jgi:hypothetical protein
VFNLLAKGYSVPDRILSGDRGRDLGKLILATKFLNVSLVPKDSEKDPPESFLLRQRLPAEV